MLPAYARWQVLPRLQGLRLKTYVRWPNIALEMALKLTAVKAKALILSALLLLPATATAGAQVVNAAPAPAVVKVTEVDLPIALSDEELDTIKGENNPGYLVNPAVGAVISVGMVVATPQGREALANAGQAVVNAGQAAFNAVKEKLMPDPKATGAHCTWKCDGHVEWQPNTQNPSGWDGGQRVRTDGKPHGTINPPITYPGGKGNQARPSLPGEYPTNGYPKKP